MASAVDPANAAVQVDLDGTAVVHLAEGAQLGHLPEPASNPAGRQPTSPPAHLQEHPMAFTPGDRVELVATNDPYTRLQPGDRGTVTGVHDLPEPTIDVHWDTGSTLSVLPSTGDRIRHLTSGHPSGDPDPAARSPATSSRPGPSDRQAGHAPNRPDGPPCGATPTQPGCPPCRDHDATTPPDQASAVTARTQGGASQ